MLSKVRDFVHKKTLQSIHLFYCCLVWAQNINSGKSIPLHLTKEIFTTNVFFES